MGDVTIWKNYSMGDVTISKSEYRVLLSSAVRMRTLKDYIRANLKDGFIDKNSVMAIIGMEQEANGDSNDA